MKTKLIIFLVIILAGVFAIVQLPADLIFNHATGISSKHVQGTLWQGKAKGLKVNNVSLDEVDWQITPASMASFGSVGKVDIKIGDSSLKANIASVFSGRIELSDIRGNLKVYDLLEIMRQYNNLTMPLSLDGAVMVDFKDIAVQDNKQLKSANGTIELADVKLGGQKVRGDYVVHINTVKENVLAKFVSTNDAELDLNGNASLKPDGSYKIYSKVSPAAEVSDTLRFLLKFIGINDKNSYRVFAHQGKIKY